MYSGVVTSDKIYYVNLGSQGKRNGNGQNLNAASEIESRRMPGPHAKNITSRAGRGFASVLDPPL